MSAHAHNEKEPQTYLNVENIELSIAAVAQQAVQLSTNTGFQYGDRFMSWLLQLIPIYV